MIMETVISFIHVSSAVAKLFDMPMLKLAKSSS